MFNYLKILSHIEGSHTQKDYSRHLSLCHLVQALFVLLFFTAVLQLHFMNIME